MNLKTILLFNLSDKIIFLFLSCIVKDVFGKDSWSSTSFLCSLCGTKTTKFIKDFCPSPVYHTDGRCCLNSSNNTIGIDLGNCNITNLPQLGSIKEVSWINLALNPKLNCKEDNLTNAFEGFQHLNMIILPNVCHTCPGGNRIWRHHHDDETQASFNCTGQLDCNHLNRTCPSHSSCSSNGPGFYECLCSDGYYGYRCLITNGMPMLLTLCVIAGATVVIIIPIWFLIWRRKKIHRSGYMVIE